MEKLRRPAITAIVLTVTVITFGALVAARTMRHQEEKPSDLTLKTGPEPGALTVRNNGGSPLQVERKLGIEKKQDDRWVSITADFELIANCADLKKTVGRTVRVPPKTSIEVVRWTGYSCSGQCQGSCRANIAYAPAEFRFVATLTAANQQVYSDPFKLPATDKR